MPMRGDGHLLPVFVLIFTSLTARATETPRFTSHPQSAVVAADAPVTLTCAAWPPDVALRWTVDGEAVLTDVAAGVRVDGGRLDIAAFRRRRRRPGRGGQHAGRYRCIAQSDVGAVVSEEAVLRTAFIGHFRDDRKDKTVMAMKGNVAVIPCEPPKGEPIAVHFTMNNTTIQQSAGRYHLMESGNLQISGVKASDAGTYQCVAVNTLSGQSRRSPRLVHLSVVAPVTNVAPSIIWQPPGTAIEVMRGDRLALECVMQGAPVPVVTWGKYGGHLPEGRFTQLLGNLIIENVQLQDQGTYICRAHNDIHPPQTVVAMVTVLEPLSVDITPRARVVSDGATTSFECRLSGNLPVSVQWLYNAQPLHQGNFVNISDNGGNDSSVELSRVQRGQSGMYQCVGSTRLAVAVATARLQVLPPGETADPHLVAEMAATEAAEAAAATAVKTTTRRPPETDPVDEDGPGRRRPSAARGRQRGGGQRGKGRRKRPRTHGRRVPPSSEEELEEESRDNARLVPPRQPLASQVSDTVVRLQWSVPDNTGLAITFFKVQFKDVTASDRRHRQWRTLQENIRSDVRLYEVPDLTPGDTYKFRVLAVFSNDDNKQSANSAKLTLRRVAGGGGPGGGGRSTLKVPVGKPVIVQVTALSDVSISLMWQYLDADSEPAEIDGFLVDCWPYHDPSPAGDAYRQRMVPGGAIRQLLLDGLQPATPYSLRVRAYNKYGTSRESNPVVKQTFAVGGLGPDDGRYPPGVLPTSPAPGAGAGASSTAAGGGALLPSNSQSTEKSNELLYLTLGVVLGGMLLLLLVFTVMCACRQRQLRQQRRMMAEAIESRCKFDDASHAVYTDSLRDHQVAAGVFQLESLNGKPAVIANGNGHVGTGIGGEYRRANGVRTSVPGRPEAQERNNSLNELRASLQQVLQPAPSSRTGRCSNCESRSDQSSTDISRDTVPSLDAACRPPRGALPPLPRAPGGSDTYEPPDYSSIGSRRRVPPALPQRHRPAAAVAAEGASPDHIPRLHEWSAHRAAGGRGDAGSSGGGRPAGEARVAHKHRRRKVTSSAGSGTRDMATNTDLSSDESIQQVASPVAAARPQRDVTASVAREDSETHLLTSDPELREETRLAEEQERLLRVNEYPPSDQDD